MEHKLISYVSQWMTIQPSLFSFLDDELGELDGDQKTFVRVCSLALAEENFAAYRWCGNGRPPTSHVSIRDGVEYTCDCTFQQAS